MGFELVGRFEVKRMVAMNVLQVCLILCSVSQVSFYPKSNLITKCKCTANISQATNADLAGDLERNGLTTLLDLVIQADLAETLGEVEPATIFAPTNSAFESVLDKGILRLFYIRRSRLLRPQSASYTAQPHIKLKSKD